VSWKSWSVSLLAANLVACAGPQPVRVYISQPERGLVRQQSGEVIPYHESGGYYCVSGDDMENLLFLMMELSEKNK
jgi:hypothetical protein